AVNRNGGISRSALAENRKLPAHAIAISRTRIRSRGDMGGSQKGWVAVVRQSQVGATVGSAWSGSAGVARIAGAANVLLGHSHEGGNPASRRSGPSRWIPACA